MSLRNRHFGQIASVSADETQSRVDVGALVRRLLLFDHCILESSRLREVPALVQAFGFDGLMSLLRSPNFEVVCDAMTAGSVGQVDFMKATERRGGPLSLGSYRIDAVAMADRKTDLHAVLQEVHKAPGLKRRQVQKLKAELTTRLLAYPKDVGKVGVSNFEQALGRNDPILERSLSLALEQEGISSEGPFNIRIEDLGNDGDYRVESNLVSDLGLAELDAHKLMERALLGVAGLEQRLELMRTLDALTGFRDAELALFENRLAFIARELDPGAEEERFNRVVTIGGLPSLEDLGPNDHIDVDRLLEVRETPECIEFRRWLRSVDSETDEEIADAFGSLREKVAAITHSRAGTTVRFLIESGAGAIPVAGMLIGPGLTLADKYLIDNLVGSPGPITFLGRTYRSLFES